MHIGRLPLNFADFITKEKDFLQDLIAEGLDVHLISKAIHYMTLPPFECNEVFFDAPGLEEAEAEIDPELAKNVWSAIRFLSALMSNPILEGEEKEWLKSILERIDDDYEIDPSDRKDLLHSFISQENITHIEDYAVYPDAGIGWYIDKDLNAEQEYQGKLVTMLYNYLKAYSVVVNEGALVGQTRRYKPKDLFELIAEILNLRWHGKYDYQTVKILYGKYRKRNRKET